MKTLEQIIETATDEDGVLDLNEAINLCSLELEGQRVPQPPPNVILDAFIDSVDASLMYLGHMILSVADEINALPNGYDAEFTTLAAALEWHKVAELYKRYSAAVKAHSGLTIVSGEVPPLTADEVS